MSLDPDAKIAVVRLSAAWGEDHVEGIEYAIQKAGSGQLVADISFEQMATDLTP